MQADEFGDGAGLAVGQAPELAVDRGRHVNGASLVAASPRPKPGAFVRRWSSGEQLARQGFLSPSLLAASNSGSIADPSYELGCTFFIH